MNPKRTLYYFAKRLRASELMPHDQARAYELLKLSFADVRNKTPKDSLSSSGMAMNMIQNMCMAAGISETDLLTSTKGRPVRARQLVMSLLCKSGFGCVMVGSYFGVDHSTVIHSKSVIQDYLDTGEPYAVELMDKYEQYKAMI